jgi:hypothetical protein
MARGQPIHEPPVTDSSPATERLRPRQGIGGPTASYDLALRVIDGHSNSVVSTRDLPGHLWEGWLMVDPSARAHRSRRDVTPIAGAICHRRRLAYDVTTTAAIDGPITLCFNVSHVVDPVLFATPRGTAWRERRLDRPHVIGQLRDRHHLRRYAVAQSVRHRTAGRPLRRPTLVRQHQGRARLCDPPTEDSAPRTRRGKPLSGSRHREGAQPAEDLDCRDFDDTGRRPRKSGCRVPVRFVDRRRRLRVQPEDDWTIERHLRGDFRRDRRFGTAPSLIPGSVA